jgi:PAS domain S-box-containing protein
MSNLTDDSGQKPREGQPEVDYRILFESSNDGIFVVRDGVVVDANNRVLDMFGCGRYVFLGKSIAEISPEHQPGGKLSADLLKEATIKVMSGEPERGQWMYLRPDGSQFLAEVTLSLLISSHGDMVIAALRDITKEREMAEMFENLFRINPVSMTLTDFQTGCILDVNESFTDIYGFAPDEAVGKTRLELGIWTSQEDMERYRDQPSFGGRVSGYEVSLRNKRGELILVLVNSVVLKYGERKALLTMSQDISKLRQAEMSLRTIFEEAPHALVVSDLNTGVMINANNRFLEMLGYQRDEIIGKMGKEFDNISDSGRARLMTLINQERRFDNEESFVIRKSGERRIILISACVILFEGRMAVLSAIQDITSQKQAEQALRESEEKYVKLFSANPDFISVSDIETGLYYEANEGLKDLLGYAREELIGKSSLELGMWVDVDERARFVESVKNKGEALNFWIKFRGKDGKVFDATISSKAIDFGEKKCMLNVVKDMTEQVKLEEQLRHSQRMEAIGRLAGGVAHDFNNILTGIVGHVELAISKLGEENPAAGNLDMVMDLANKATQLSHSMLAFSRKQVLNREIVRLSEIIRKSETFLKRLIGEDIEFYVNLKDDATVNVDALQIEQVITNIVLNARDAMLKGGRLTIITDIVDIEEFTALQYQLERTGRYICITISDTGSGMTEEIMEKIFDPFFTTKNPGKGTGLGLSMAYGNIRQHGGFISVFSEVGIGSEFRIFLPVSQGAEAPAKVEREYETTGGKETILIAEDDEVVRDLDELFLEKSGYTVLNAGDGEEAIRIFNDNMEKISMVILDVIMPKKNGKEVFEAIKLVKPSMKFLFISGYTDDYISERSELGHDVELLLKPVAPRILLNKVRETLDR